jgi:predicted HTH domain antitoxin
MESTQVFRNIAAEIQLFPDLEQKQNFVFVVGALVVRAISLQKAAEIMNLKTDVFLQILDLMGLEFSYLSEEDVLRERSW